MSARRLAALLLSLAGAVAASGQDPGGPALPPLGAQDRVRLAEAFSLMAVVQDSVWPEWSRAPADLLLVDRDHEYLLRSREHPEGFVALRPDPLLGAPLLARKRTFPADLLATLPAFGSTPTIVVGTPGATGKASTEWVLTLLHEHFHQLQYSSPRYYEDSKALGLAGSDESGMWMLNYPFPYESSSASFASLSSSLASLVEPDAPVDLQQREAFWRQYSAFCDSLRPQDYRYLSFQLWQEGIARYVELRVAEAAAGGHRVSPEFASLPDYAAFAEAAARLRQTIVHKLQVATMASERRVAFYAFGAALGLLLDQEGVDWRSRYLSEKFYLEKYRAGLAGHPPG